MSIRNRYLFVFIALILPVLGSAASVELSISPTPKIVAGLSQTFTLDIVGDYNADASEALVGGAVNLINLDPSVIKVNSVTLKTPVDFGSSTGTIDNVAGEVDTIGFATFVGVPDGVFTFATVEFESVGLGTSPIGMEDAGDLILAWGREGGSPITPTFVDGSVTVVPLPAAAYLLATGLVGLVGMSRRRKLS